jgi:hypothetical protein
MHCGYNSTMLATVTKPKAKPSKPSVADEPALVQTAFRLPPHLLEGLDGLVEQVNQSRPWHKMTRTDLIRLLLTKVIDEKPDWLLEAAK